MHVHGQKSPPTGRMLDLIFVVLPAAPTSPSELETTQEKTCTAQTLGQGHTGCISTSAAPKQAPVPLCHGEQEDTTQPAEEEKVWGCPIHCSSTSASKP